ncbi:SDR family NAD(P)-dependent oxidoreductase [Acidocella aminolytica]|uniref:Oxidoreductase/SDR, 3-oxoacyl-(Acyl carrier protein) reductase n=1 Tax=Acidocella aminolytica 101 = DSM 11237 TaxID=1120923 RepID=A0A0D6PIR2_9PROT|nr:SDR family oxidoreductase [Acidocella aminolytica]GAN81640.1 oxidoreductase/SDR, 3-oxoacyl-(acyl carrier protein) reductase [Acidocella aminolytica 101 = DSM 11237]GBQ44169.1 oxidoreductase [Acidocella aminolytica 101 = DSM 11237]SHF41897.1 3-oxoacyl-[acyl-carrier protein] reductase [Acidocella aminolytica 101 = DSM 11237]
MMPAPDQIQTAVITGGGGGFGAAAARALHKAGFRVVVGDIDSSAAEALAAELDLSGETAVTATLDVSKPEHFQHVLDRIISRWGSAEVLVNNAARTAVQPVLEITPEDFNAIMAVNAGGTFAGSQIFGRHFKARGYGRIINLASLAGQNGGTATGAHYAASKGAILTLTKVFARDLAPFGVTVNAIAPGPMDTPMVRSVLTGDKLAATLANIPVGHLGDPDFVASLVVMLAAPSAGFVTGACWDVNGGIYMR